MNEMTVAELIRAGFPDAIVTVEGDGAHFQATIVSDHFKALGTLQRQKLVYRQLNDVFQSGALHALSMQTYTHEEWQSAHR